MIPANNLSSLTRSSWRSIIFCDFALERFIIQALNKLKVIILPRRVEKVKASRAYRSQHKKIVLIPSWEHQRKWNDSLRECITSFRLLGRGKVLVDYMKRKCAVIRPHDDETYNFLSALTFPTAYPSFCNALPISSSHHSSVKLFTRLTTLSLMLPLGLHRI